MRQLLLIASLVGLFMYTGFVVEYGTGIPTSSATSVGAVSSAPSLAALEDALAATGAGLDRVVITGWVRASQSGARDQVAKALGWKEKAPSGETQELKLVRRDGVDYLALRWVLTGSARASWQAKQGKVREVLGAAGADLNYTVQLEGATERTDFAGAGAGAMEILDARDRQPWSDAHAVSIAGRTGRLPASAFGVNVQVAVRRNADQGGSRVWVAWPALQQEY
jgi:hypothetical protein